jgi:hypothetical protein
MVICRWVLKGVFGRTFRDLHRGITKDSVLLEGDAAFLITVRRKKGSRFTRKCFRSHTTSNLDLLDLFQPEERSKGRKLLNKQLSWLSVIEKYEGDQIKEDDTRGARGPPSVLHNLSSCHGLRIKHFPLSLSLSFGKTEKEMLLPVGETPFSKALPQSYDDSYSRYCPQPLQKNF